MFLTAFDAGKIHWPPHDTMPAADVVSWPAALSCGGSRGSSGSLDGKHSLPPQRMTFRLDEACSATVKGQLPSNPLFSATNSPFYLRQGGLSAGLSRLHSLRKTEHKPANGLLSAWQPATFRGVSRTAAVLGKLFASLATAKELVCRLCCRTAEAFIAIILRQQTCRRSRRAPSRSA